MNSTDSLNEFFYNIVPGSLFVLTLRYFLDIHISALIAFSGHNESDNGAVVIFLILIIGLFFGFLFQAFTKIIRSHLFHLNKKVFKEISCEDPESFEYAIMLLKKVKLIDKKEGTKGIKENPEKIKRVFYLMDNYLRGMNKSNMLKHFTARLAFWSNTFFGSMILLVVVFTPLNQKNDTLTPILFLFFIFCFSWRLFYIHLKILYDSVLKTFVTVLSPWPK